MHLTTTLEHFEDRDWIEGNLNDTESVFPTCSLSLRWSDNCKTYK